MTVPLNGMLTAMEAGSLNLRGTELVVLSACSTGQRDVKNGNGVFGLRRAFEEAGAQSVLMSLWSVSDKEKLKLMQRFYSGSPELTAESALWQVREKGGMG